MEEWKCINADFKVWIMKYNLVASIRDDYWYCNVKIFEIGILVSVFH